VVKLVDTTDLKSVETKVSYRFDSGSGHQKTSINPVKSSFSGFAGLSSLRIRYHPLSFFRIPYPTKSRPFSDQGMRRNDNRQNLAASAMPCGKPPSERVFGFGWHFAVVPRNDATVPVLISSGVRWVAVLHFATVSALQKPPSLQNRF
jgi:hypothetical protein